MSTQVTYIPFVEKYRPKTKRELVGNKAAIDRVDRFLSEWDPNKKPKGILLVGPPGIGKTTAVYALANDHDMDVVEFNASDNRNKKDLLEFVQPLTEYENLFSERKKVILIDEVDGLSGQKDRGAVPTLSKLIQSTRYPIILCANDIEDNKVQTLAKNVPLVQFTRPDEFTIFELLEKIAEKEGIRISEDDLQIIAEAAAGDIRAALNELESFKFGTGKTYVPASRDKMKTWVDYFNGIFFAKTASEARAATQNSPTSDYRMILNYLFDLAHRYCSTPDELERTYRVLAAADLVLARISRTLDWSLLRYFFQLIGPGLFWARNSHGGKRLTSVTNLPLAFFAIGRGKQVNKLAMELADLVHHKLHVGKKEFVYHEFPYFMRLMHGEIGAKIVAWLDLEDSVVEKIVKYTKDKSILKHLEEARTEIGKMRVEEASDHPHEFSDNAVEELIKSRIFEEMPEKKKGRRTKKKIAKSKKKKPVSSTPPPENDEKASVEEKPKDKSQFSLDDFF